MYKYEIWADSYSITGQSSISQRHGVATGSTFEEACENFFINDRIKPDKFYCKKRNTYWGCRLFGKRVQ